MTLKKLALIPLMFCLAASGCTTVREAVSTRPDRDNPERMVCEFAEARPALPSSYSIDWARVVTVGQARAEHEAFVERVIARNGVVTGYLVSIEGKLFLCANNAEWWRDYWSRVPSE